MENDPLDPDFKEAAERIYDAIAKSILAGDTQASLLDDDENLLAAGEASVLDNQITFYPFNHTVMSGAKYIRIKDQTYPVKSLHKCTASEDHYHILFS